MQVLLKVKLISDKRSVSLLKRVDIAQAPAPGDFVVDHNEDYQVKHTCYPAQPLEFFIYPLVVLKPLMVGSDADMDRCVDRFEAFGWKKQQ